jgi:hypothetical protein
MADNFTTKDAADATITGAADEIGGVKFPRVKLIIGADGTNDGDVASGNPMPVSDAGGSLTVDGTVAVTNAGITTIAGAVSGTEMQVDVLTMPTVTVNSHAVTNAGTFAVQVDSCSLPTGAATAAKQLPDGHSVALSATDNAVLDAIAASDASIDGKITACNTGAVVISSGSCTVDLGANNDVTVTNATAANLKCEEASASAIKTAVEIIDNAISGSEMQVDVVTLPAVTGAVTANPSKLATTDDADFVRKYYTNAGAVTDGIVWSPAAGKRWYITDIIVNTSAAATITFEDDKAAGDDPVLKLELAANGGFVSNFKTPFASGEDAADLIVTTSAGNIYIAITGYEV